MENSHHTPARAAPIKTSSAIGKRVSQATFSRRRFCDNPMIRLARTMLKARRLDRGFQGVQR